MPVIFFKTFILGESQPDTLTWLFDDSLIGESGENGFTIFNFFRFRE